MNALAFENTRGRALALVLRFADEGRITQVHSLEDVRLADIGYDSLSIAELAMAVEHELEDCGVTTRVDDDLWDISLKVSKVATDVETLLNGKDLR